MAAKYTKRNYVPNGYYHVYNRGVEKRIIFLDEHDYRMFLYYLFIYVANPKVIKSAYPKLKYNLLKNNMYDEIALLAYCLMPNHFHFLLKQFSEQGITKFMRRLTTAYTHYFNTKYDRVGGLLQGVFKSKIIESDEYLLYLTSYIHRNPHRLEGYGDLSNLSTYPWSSYSAYLAKGTKSSIIQNEEIMSFFSKRNSQLSYETFVLQTPDSLLPSDILIDD